MGKINHLLALAYLCGGTIAPYRIVKFGSADTDVLQSSAASDKHIGVANPVGASSFVITDRIDIVRVGLAEVELGGVVTRGDNLTADSLGRAINITDAMLAAGVVNSIGKAEESGVASDIASVMLNGYPFTVLPGVQECTLVVGAEDTNVIKVTGTLKDSSGNALAVRTQVRAYLSDDANGDSIVATAPSGGAAIAANGVAIPVVAGKAFLITSEANGVFDLNITEAGTKTEYLIVVMPNGALIASGAITHAA